MPTMWYELDINDRFVAVSEDWNASSDMLGAPSNAFENIRYLPVWDFVAGEETQRFLRAMFFWVRNKRRPIVLPYQLENMGDASHFRMRIEPLHQGGLLVSHDPDDVPGGAPQLLPYTTKDLTRCSQCLKINIDGVWYNAEPESELHECSDWRVCPDCKERALNLVRQPTGAPVARYARATLGKF